MTKVDFYILPADSVEQRHLFACRLAEKAYKLGNHIYIHSDDHAQANTLDQLLWSWRKGSFVPHQVAPASPPPPINHELPAAIVIGFGDGANISPRHNDLLINLSNNVPDFFSRFERVSEIVVQEPAITKATRTSFRFYRDRGYPLNTHDLRN